MMCVDTELVAMFPETHAIKGGGALPSLGPEGLQPGNPNPFMGPYIRFEPGTKPFFVPGK